jgi:hypothetical protein
MMKVLLATIIVLAMVVSGVAAVDNMVDNPGFDVDLEGWSIGAEGELSIAAVGIAGNCMFAAINELGADAWVPEIHSPAFGLNMGTTYTMDFWAKTEPGMTRDLGVKFEQLDLWGGPSGIVNVTDQWEHLYFTGESDFQSPPDSVIHIQFEGSLADIWFDEFRVYEGEYQEPDLASVTPMDRLTTSWGRIKSK